MKRILIQGAMESELCWYREQSCFADVPEETIHGFSFWRASYGECEFILQLTKMGMTNAALATMAAIHAFQPEGIINQGTAGAHVRELKRGDIVIGAQAVNVHSLEMEKRGYGEGMAPEDWCGMHTEYLPADKELLSLFENRIGTSTKNGKVVSGVLGSGDLFSKEKDRILWLHDTFHNLSEDMETFAVYAACQACHIPCLGIRVMSNNELLDEDFDEKSSLELQRLIWETLLSFCE